MSFLDCFNSSSRQEGGLKPIIQKSPAPAVMPARASAAKPLHSAPLQSSDAKPVVATEPVVARPLSAYAAPRIEIPKGPPPPPVPSSHVVREATPVPVPRVKLNPIAVAPKIEPAPRIQLKPAVVAPKPEPPPPVLTKLPDNFVNIPEPPPRAMPSARGLTPDRLREALARKAAPPPPPPADRLRESIAALRRGVVLQAKGEHGPAIAEFDRAIELDSQCIEAYAARGISRELQGDVSGAKEDYTRSISFEVRAEIDRQRSA
jgi:hypothetical protein